MQLGARLECVGSSSRVSEACQDGVMEFAERRPRLTRRLSRVAEKLAGSWEVSDGWTARTLETGWLPATELPRSLAEPPVPDYRAIDDG
ncbi:hypothetical protein BHE74_00052089 [Ensete ventricosum]|nr:hypothetical protein GW17_00048632 [Ensete ventricosum]RWW42376.1 hypothetical protein BHE74_00052089 [Ensete ventricosum]